MTSLKRNKHHRVGKRRHINTADPKTWSNVAYDDLSKLAFFAGLAKKIPFFSGHDQKLGSSLSVVPIPHVREKGNQDYRSIKETGMDLEFDKYCVVDGSPNTVLPPPRQCSKIERVKPNGKHKCGNDPLNQNKGFTDFTFHRYHSVSCKVIPSRAIRDGNEVLKRVSVYQSSQELRKMKKMEDVGGRKKIEFPRRSGTAFSLGIVDSLCSSDEDSLLLEQNRSSMMSLNSESSTSVSKPHNSEEFLDLSFLPVPERGVSSDSFLQKLLGSDSRQNQSAENVERLLFEDSKGRCNPGVGPLKHGNGLGEKRGLPHLPSHSESDCSTLSNPKSHFSPIRKMFDSFAKSKLERSTLGSSNGSDEVTPSEKVSISRNKTSRRSLLHDFSNMARDTQLDSQFVQKGYNKPLVPCSPAHLRGLLKLEKKHGMPFFEFSVKNPEDNFVAKAWKVGNALNWVYTFHTHHNKRRSNATGWGLKERNKESSMVGQMQVSCFLCTELKDARSFDSSIVTEFVLYDIAQARKKITAQNDSLSLPEVAKPPKGLNDISTRGTCKLDETSDQTKNKVQPKHASESGRNPWEPADLHPNLETATIVIQVPFEKRESLKGKRVYRKSDQPLPNLYDLPGIEQRTSCLSPAKVNVVTSSGNHSFPTTESPGPSRLLDRWKLGGGCDCGGWDMGCPLVILGNSDIQCECAEDHPLMNNQLPWKLHVWGEKDKTPALRMRATDQGEYEVDFHAQLTTLQAFSICDAILHTTEASIAVGHERDNQLLHCDSLRVFIDEDVKYLIESVTEEKRKANKEMEAPKTFLLDPPFSPMARV